MDGKTSYDLKPRSNLEETNLLKFKPDVFLTLAFFRPKNLKD